MVSPRLAAEPALIGTSRWDGFKGTEKTAEKEVIRDPRPKTAEAAPGGTGNHVLPPLYLTKATFSVSFSVLATSQLRNFA